MVTVDSDIKIESESLPKIHTIRSHHLVFIGWAMGFGARAGTPESVAAGFTATVLQWRRSKEPYLRRYARTTVGSFGETAEAYEKSLAAGLREFVEAPDEQLFTIVEEIPDSIICERMEGCQLADHCRRRMAELSDGTVGELDETREMQRFLNAANYNEIPLNIQSGMADYVDAEPRKVRSVTLTAGEIRKVLHFINESEIGFADFFDEPQWEL